MNISKKGQILLFPPPDLNDYLILIAPPTEIKKEIKKINSKMHKILGTIGNHTAHITLFNSAWEQDTHLLERLKKAISDIKSFSIALNGVEVFSHGTKKKTIYLKVTEPKPLLELYEACKKELKIKNDYTPHLTLEKNIALTDFEKLQNKLEEFNYPCNWICDKITVLKFNKKKSSYKLVEEIMLL